MGRGRMTDLSLEDKVLIKVLRQFLDKDLDLKGINETTLHKTLFLVQKSAEDKNIGLNFDYYWYRYGPMVEQAEAPVSNVGSDFVETTESAGHKLYKPGEKSKEVEDENEEIDSIVQNVVGDVNPFSIKKTIGRVYREYAPYKFQNIFRLEFYFGLDALRNEIESTEETKLTSFTEENYPDLNEVLFQLQRTKTTIPEEGYFKPFREPYLRFCSYVKDYLKRKSELTKDDIEHIEELSEDVWNTFAYALKLSTVEDLSEKEEERLAKDYKSRLDALNATLSSLEKDLEIYDARKNEDWDEAISQSIGR
jgi:hypothetical protein